MLTKNNKRRDRRHGKVSQIKALSENFIIMSASGAVSDRICCFPYLLPILHSHPPLQRPEQQETKLILKTRK